MFYFEGEVSIIQPQLVGIVLCAKVSEDLNMDMVVRVHVLWN